MSDWQQPISLTLTSLKLKMSVVNVELPTVGLFFTLGNMTPPFRDVALLVLTLNALVGIVFDWTLFCVLLDDDDDVDVDDDDDDWFDDVDDDDDDCDDCDDVGVTNELVVVWIWGGSVNSSINEYLMWIWLEYGKKIYWFFEVKTVSITKLILTDNK